MRAAWITRSRAVAARAFAITSMNASSIVIPAAPKSMGVSSSVRRSRLTIDERFIDRADAVSPFDVAVIDRGQATSQRRCRLHRSQDHAQSPREASPSRLMNAPSSVMSAASKSMRSSSSVRRSHLTIDECFIDHADAISPWRRSGILRRSRKLGVEPKKQQASRRYTRRSPVCSLSYNTLPVLDSERCIATYSKDGQSPLRSHGRETFAAPAVSAPKASMMRRDPVKET